MNKLNTFKLLKINKYSKYIYVKYNFSYLLNNKVIINKSIFNFLIIFSTCNPNKHKLWKTKKSLYKKEFNYVKSFKIKYEDITP